MTSALKQVGWNANPAKLIWLAAIHPKTPAGFSSTGARGCYLSHLAVLNMARIAGHRRVPIMEDDCSFVSNFQHCQRRIAEALD
jgi:GR25 family glycosyltransferase involved in LPS biosynthesis